ncbi:hypothetical protein I3271_09175 [Photobacterium leiognathi]|uniref:hypothetical protein n=1 Tax=Photobacterium leiognathi TaxID=553611 RepID=UPI001EDD9EFF|nr:hypothetical protein [Photobacterium leiognathi]MCG3884860.1 hypothetical protein [Photobacterium leiognathi]
MAYIAVYLHGCVRTHSLDLSVAQEFSQLNGLIEIVILGLINRMIVSDMADSNAISNHEIGYTDQHLQSLRGCEHSKISGYSSSFKVTDSKDSHPDLDRVFGDFFERFFGRKK